MVLMIVGLLLGGMMIPLSAVMENRGISETKKTLEDAREALVGFAVINGRLPCPASSASNGTEKFVSGGSAATGGCANFNNGYLPAATLGITPTDTSGFAVDAWGNRIRYAVTSWSSNAFTKTNGMKSVGISTLAPDLLVCSTASANSTSCSVSNSTLASGVPIIIFSTGAKSGAGTDENENADNDKVFVSHSTTSSSAANGAFDDLVIWLSPNVLINRLIQAGQLP